MIRLENGLGGKKILCFLLWEGLEIWQEGLKIKQRMINGKVA